MSEWIESHTSLPRHRKTKRLSRRLGISIRDTVGCLHMLWYYAADFAPSGNLDGHAPEDIASGCDWDGDSREFVEALTDSGWLESTPAGLVVHDWDDYNRQYRERQKAAQRQRDKRARESESHESHCDVTVTSRATDRQDKTDRQEEEARDGLLPVDNLSEEEKAALNRLRSVEGYHFDYGKDLAYLRQLTLDFPQVDVLEQVAGWAAWTLDHPLVANSKPHSQLRNRCANAIKFGQTKAPPPPKRDFRVAPPPLSPDEEAAEAAEQTENARRAREQVARLGADVRRHAAAVGAS